MKHIYVIDNGNGVVKIGVAKNVSDRIVTISRLGGFEPANVYYTEKCSNSYEVETYIHKQLNDLRTKGEWFKMTFNEAVEIVKVLFRENAKFESGEEKEPIVLEQINSGLSEKEKHILDTLQKLLPSMTEVEKAQLLGFGLGLAAREERQKEERTEVTA